MNLSSLSSIHQLKPNDLALLGIPFDANSSFMRGPAEGPKEIRKQLHCGSANYTSELGLNLEAHTQFHDLGDLSFQNDNEWFDPIYQNVNSILAQGAKTLSLGGDHSITWPIIRAYAQHHKPLSILQIDAHPDLYDELDGNREAHACPFARIMEEGLVERLVQIGIRTLNDHQREQAERFGVEIIEMKDWNLSKLPSFTSPLYISLDLDGLDPAYAPGVSHHEPGGFSTREVLNIIHNLPTTVVGADIVELNPKRDTVGTTAMLGAKLLKELTDLLIRSNN